MTLRIEDPAYDELWPQFVFSCSIPDYAEPTAKECYELKEENPEGRSISNRGGWQSEIYVDSGKKHLDELSSHLLHIANNELPRIVKGQFTVQKPEWWVNINGANSFNLPHGHGNLKLICVYYPQLPEDPGTLTLFRPDINNALRSENEQEWICQPHVGRAFFFPGHILHCVANNESNEVERISIAYNFS